MSLHEGIGLHRKEAFKKKRKGREKDRLKNEDRDHEYGQFKLDEAQESVCMVEYLTPPSLSSDARMEAKRGLVCLDLFSTLTSHFLLQ